MVAGAFLAAPCPGCRAADGVAAAAAGWRCRSRVPARADRAHAHRRAVAQRRAGGHGAAAARVLRAAVRRAARLPDAGAARRHARAAAR